MAALALGVVSWPLSLPPPFCQVPARPLFAAFIQVSGGTGGRASGPRRSCAERVSLNLRGPWWPLCSAAGAFSDENVLMIWAKQKPPFSLRKPKTSVIF